MFVIISTLKRKTPNSPFTERPGKVVHSYSSQKRSTRCRGHWQTQYKPHLAIYYNQNHNKRNKPTTAIVNFSCNKQQDKQI